MSAIPRYEPGTPVVDLATGREGILQGYATRDTEIAFITITEAMIRPANGGREWGTKPSKVRPIAHE